MRARLAAASLGPVDFAEDTPLGRLTETLLDQIRPHHAGEDHGIIYLLALKPLLSNQACRVLIRQGGLDLDLIETALEHIT
jgi:hypothetical protein